MDCMEGMGQFPDKYFDLAIVDPPYGIGVSSHSTFGNPNIVAKNSFLKKPISPSNYRTSEWDKCTPDDQYFVELKRLSKKQIVWGINYFDNAKIGSGRLFWDKEGTGNYSRGELAGLSFVNRIEYYYFKWCGMLQGDMKNKEKRIHPTQKPVKLYRWLLANYGEGCDTILDTHVGSGSSLIACEFAGFDYVGFEIDTDYYNAAKKRMERERAQLTLDLHEAG